MSNINWENLLSRVETCEKDVDTNQQNIYIVAGALGGVDLILIVVLIVLISLITKLKTQLQEAEEQKRVKEEIDAQKLTAYTGEEMHRKLLAVTTPAVPLSQTGSGPEGEYAFNVPFSTDNRKLGVPTTTSGVMTPPRFSKY